MIAAALLLGVVLPASAQQLRREGGAWVEESQGTFSGAKAIRVQADLGSIFIEPGAQNFAYTVRKRSFAASEQEARRQFELLRVSHGVEGEFAVLRLVAPGARRFGGNFNADIRVRVPHHLKNVLLRTMGGNITVGNMPARMDVQTMGGSIKLGDVGPTRAHTMGGGVSISSSTGDVWVKSGGGPIWIGNVNGRVDVAGMGGNVEVRSMSTGFVHTAGGSISVGRCNGDLQAKTMGGTVYLNEVAGRAMVETGGGNIKIGTAKGPVVASTGGGNIEMWKLYRGAQAQSGAGAITAEFLGGKGAFGESYLRTAAGDVVVYLNGGLPATVRASSEMASGKGIRSDFPELKISTEGGDFGPKTMYADGVLNGGGPMLKVRTTIGQIEFRRAK